MKRRVLVGGLAGLLIVGGLAASIPKSWGQSAESEIQGGAILRMVTARPRSSDAPDFVTGPPVAEDQTGNGPQFLQALQDLNPEWDIRPLGRISTLEAPSAAEGDLFEGHAEMAYMGREGDGKLHAIVNADLQGKVTERHRFGFRGLLNLELEEGKVYQIASSREEGDPTRTLVFASLAASQGG